ncbi:MAG: putative oxidoreductase, partial [Bacteroidia bacterium]
MKKYKADVVIAGGGLAGIVTALELLNEGKTVTLLERGKEENFGGLAKESFGGMFFVNSSQQRKAGMKDSVELALRDWHSVADFGEEDILPKKWAEQYVNLCTNEVQIWLNKLGVKYFPVVHWVERGLHKPGNSLPRFHMVWGTGHGLTTALISHLKSHPKATSNLQLLFDHKCEEITVEGNRACGITGVSELDGTEFSVVAENVVVATGGMGGNIQRVKDNWYKPWGTPPERILNGSHPFCDGAMHDAVSNLKGHITHLDHQWHYAAGVNHPRPRWKNHGLSLVPPKSALWFDYQGRRFGPEPLITAYDTRWTVEEICKQKKKHSWQ